MDQSINKKPEFKENLKIFFKSNKKKIIFLIFLIILVLAATLIWSVNQSKKNLLISEKYVKAGVLLSNNDKDNAIKYFEEIIFSKNKLYSLLALNTIIEKNLISDKNKILNYFEILEEGITHKDYVDLVIFKKALFLIKNSESQKGNLLLNNLIKNDSNLKIIAKEIISK